MQKLREEQAPARQGRGPAGKAGKAVPPRHGERVRGKEVESRRAVMLDWRGERDQGVEMNWDLREME